MTLLENGKSPASAEDPDALIEEAREAQRRRYRRWGGGLTALLLALIGGGLLLFSGGGDPPVHAGRAPAVIHGSLPAGITARAADPNGGLPWGIRLVRSDGYTCVQLGRLQGDQLGMVGIDRMFHDDGTFHPFAPSASYHAQCAQNDGNGHAFMTFEAGSQPASGALDGYTPNSGCDSPSEQAGIQRAKKRFKNRPGLRAFNPEFCPVADMRFIQYGMLGPDATSITYSYNKHVITEKASGPDGAYLVVGLATPSFCSQLSKYGACGSNGNEPSSIAAGMIDSVSYRNGTKCTLGGARTPALQTCPKLGYVAPQPLRDSYGTPSPVKAYLINATHYCFKTNEYYRQTMPAPATDLGPYLPCNGTVPANEIRAQGNPQGSDIVFSFTARKASTSTALYEYAINRNGPQADGCGSGGGGTINGRVRGGEHITRARFLPSDCTGTFTGAIYYLPNVGPQGTNAGPPVSLFGSQNKNAIEIGQFKVAIH